MTWNRTLALLVPVRRPPRVEIVCVDIRSLICHIVELSIVPHNNSQTDIIGHLDMAGLICQGNEIDPTSSLVQVAWHLLLHPAPTSAEY